MTARLILILSFLVIRSTICAHPGSGIVVDRYGNIYFTDTGKGVWKIETNGNLTYLPASRFHWMTMDTMGSFAHTPKNFGGYFERVTVINDQPVLIMCSDFPLVAGQDGNIYFADTRAASAKIIRRTPEGRETLLASHKIVEFVNGIAAGTEGSIYITESSNVNANTIRKIRMDGTITILATYVGKSNRDLPLETTPSYCRGLAVDASGMVYVAATGSRNVLKITPQGQVTTILQTTAPWTPTGVAVFHGEVYVLEWHDVAPEKLEVRTAWIPRVRKIGLDGSVTTLATISR